MTSEEMFDTLLTSVRSGSSKLLDNIGIRINLAEVPGYSEYAMLSDDLAEMSPVRRWLSFRLRRRMRDQQLQYQAAFLNTVMDKADAQT